jgi:phage portal protein, HK97 family
MGLIGHLFERKQNATMTSADLQQLIAQGGGTKAGVRVTAKQALQASTAFACARVVALGMAQVPFKLYQQQGRNRVPAVSHPLYELLYLKPNDWQTSFDLRVQIGLHLMFCGEAFVWKNTVAGKIVELLPFESGMVDVERDGWTLKYWATLANGKRQQIPASEMWHIRGPSWNGWRGLDSVRMAREAIGLSLAAEEHGSLMFRNGLATPGVLHSDAAINADQRAALRESIEKAQTGSNKWRLLLTWGGLKYTPSASTNEQAQFLETRRFQVEEVCRSLGVMPIMVYHSDKAATYASAEAMFKAHLVHTMGPWYTCLEQSASVNLLTPKERADGFYPKFTVNALMHANAKDKGEYITKMFNVGALSPNEIRAMDELDPYEGGDTYRVPLNTEDPANPEPDEPSATPAKDE